MSDTIIVALLSLGGTLIGAFSGILTASRLTNYRILKLEEEVEKHNSVIERTFILEGRMNKAEHDIKDLKDGK